MADQKDTYGYVTKTTGGFAHASELVIVGIDCDEEDRPELYDPARNELPIDEAMVQSVLQFGVREPVAIKTFRNDDHVYVVEGRQRVRHCREANTRRSKGTPEILVPCFVVKDDAVATFVIGNRFRRNNSVVADARTAQHLLAQGKTESEIAAMFGVSKSTLTQTWLPLAEASAAVQKAVTAGTITAGVGVEIAKTPAREQDAALRAAIEQGKGGATLANARAARKAASKGGSVSDAPRRLSLSGQKRLAATLAETINPEAELAAPIEVQAGHAMLRCILGEGLAALEAFPALQHAYLTATQPKGEEVQADA